MRRSVALVVLVGLAAAGCEAAEGACSIDLLCAGPVERFGVGGRGAGGRFMVRDLDGDGRAEWVAVSEALGTLAVTWGASGQATSWSLGQAPADLVIADVDGDGRLDVAAPLRDEGALALVRGAGPGRLGAVERVAVGERPAAAAAADLDGDGRAEVVVADGQTGELRVVRAAAGGLRVGAPIFAGQGPAALVAGEFSGDGRADVAVTLAGEGAVRLFLGTGDGGLVAGATLYAGAGPGRTAAADLDDDGALDLVVVDALLDEVAVVHGDGAGGARETRRWPVAAGPTEVAVREGPDGREILVMSSVQRALTRLPLAAPEARTTTLAHEWHALAVGDVDGDGADEVAVSTAQAATALREGPGYGFRPWYSREAGGLAGPVAAADVDGDGWLDLVVSDRERGELALLRGQEGGFAEPVRSPGPKGAEGLALADLDGDGRADVVAWRRAGYLSIDTVRKGSLWSARGVGDRFEGPVEFEFGADPRQVVPFDRDGDGRSELLALQVRLFAAGPDEGEDEDAGSGLLTLQLTDDAFALVDRAMSEELAGLGEVLVGEFSPDHAGDELLRLAREGDALVVLSESRSAGAEWRSGPLPPETRPFGLTRADVDGDGLADLLVCTDDGLVLAPGLAWNEFAPGRRLAGEGCHSAVVAELDGDGRVDLITTTRNSWGPRVEVRLGHALAWLPRYLPGGTTTASNRPIAVTVADFDRDGLPDLAASGTDGLQVLRGGPLPVLRAEPEPTTRAGFAGGLQLADVDGDGREEVVAFGAGGDVGIGRFDETGALGPVQYDMSKRAAEVSGATAAERKRMLDVDGDGVDELLWSLVLPEQGLYFTELQRVKNGRFVPVAAVAREIWPISGVRVADLDGDGDDDLVYVHHLRLLATHLGGPEGPGPALAGPRVPYDPDRLSLGDVDRDGRVDAIVAFWSGDVLVYPGDGHGGFLDAPRSWPMGPSLGPLVTGDLDGDGFGDLLAGSGVDRVGNLRVCYGGPDGPRGDCRNLPLGPDEAEVQALAVEDVDGDGVTDVLAVVSGREERRLVFGRGGEGRLVLHEKLLPRSGLSAGVAVDGSLRRVVLDDEGPEWIYVDAWEVTRLGVRAR